MAVHYRVEAGVATITLDRPDVRNAIDQATAHEVSVSLGAADADLQVRVILLTGEGGNFSVGMVLDAFRRGEVMRSPVNGFAGVTERAFKTPLIAAVEGCALAEGFEIALACDLLVASQDATFGLVQARDGIVPSAGGLVRLPRQLPSKIAAELILTADTVSARFLASFGLVNRIVPPGAALAAARELAGRIITNGPQAIEISRQVLHQSVDWQTHEMFKRQDEIIGPSLPTGAVAASALH